MSELALDYGRLGDAELVGDEQPVEVALVAEGVADPPAPYRLLIGG